MQTRIADLKERHTEDVNNLHAYYTQIRVAERADFRASVDDLPIEELEVNLLLVSHESHGELYVLGSP